MSYIYHNIDEGAEQISRLERLYADLDTIIHECKFKETIKDLVSKIVETEIIVESLCNQ